MEPVPSDLELYLVHNGRTEVKSTVRIRLPATGFEQTDVHCPDCGKRVVLRVRSAALTQQNQRTFRQLGFTFGALTAVLAGGTAVAIATGTSDAANAGVLLTILSAVAVGHAFYRIRNAGVRALGMGLHHTEVIKPPDADRGAGAAARTWLRAFRRP